MTVLDANVLLYSWDQDSPHHSRAKAWLEARIQSELIAIPWVSAWAFLRISTNGRIVASPVSAVDAIRWLGVWFAEENVIPLNPGDRHAQILERLLADGRLAGPRVTDATLVAIAVEHGASLASTDRDFARFPGLSWIDPLDEAA